MFFVPGNHKQAGLAFNPLKAIVSPRPIGWISTHNKDGVANLAPYSFFNAISELPPMVGYSAAPGPFGEKDSLTNARETGEFVVNIVSKAMTLAMNESSAAMENHHSEFDRAGLEQEASETVSAPRVKGAPCHLECKLWKILELPPMPDGRANHWVMGQITGIHIDDSIIRDGKVDVTLYQPLARLGYMDYAVVEEVFSLDRPK